MAFTVVGCAYVLQCKLCPVDMLLDFALPYWSMLPVRPERKRSANFYLKLIQHSRQFWQHNTCASEVCRTIPLNLQ